MSLRRRHTGFATLTAIAILGLSAVAITILTTSLGAKARRTSRTTSEQQLQQLLLAGEKVAQTQLQASGNISATLDVPLPKELEADRAHLTIQPAEIFGKTAKVRVEARVGRYQQSQEIAFDHDGGTWAIKSAELD